MRFKSLCLFLSLFLGSTGASAASVVIGSKVDTEGHILAELAAQTLSGLEGTSVVRRFGLGGTGLAIQALREGQVDVYPEYTGTIASAILKTSGPLSVAQINAQLAPLGLEISEPLGFSNSFALAVSADFARDHHLQSISDLRPLAQTARVAFSEEFTNRPDGYSGLSDRYDLHFGENMRSMAHSLAYEAMRKDQVDVVDVYTTDSKIAKLGLVILQDDRQFFPSYEAVYLANKKFIGRAPAEWAALQRLAGSLSESSMRGLNGAVELYGKSVAAVVAEFRGQSSTESHPTIHKILQRTREHMVLVSLALFFSIGVGIPLGILATRYAVLGQVILLLSAVVQTVPSLALLCFLIPVFGIGFRPALVALCLYGLLPVVLNTFTGLKNIDVRLLESAKALGLDPWNRLRLIELPLASRNILAGIKTSLVIGIGTATLGALIGGGGYGVPILVGLTTNDMHEILLGAIPAAAMALFAHLLFHWIERLLVPKGLQ